VPITADVERCLAVLTLAFSGDPPCPMGMAWFRNSTWRRSRALLEHSATGPLIMEQPSITRVFAASSCGCHRVQHRIRESLVRAIEDTVANERKGAMFSIFEQMDALHPQEAHWHLPLIGVDPAHQGKGIGSALLSHVSNVCDGQKAST
jgi:GNAT superfamily N-acetyltransferase